MKILILLAILLLTISTAGAEMYRWIAEDGSVTFRDTPPPSSKVRSKVKVYKDGDFAPAPPVQPAAPPRPDKAAVKAAPQTVAAAPERFSGTVEIYVTNWCGYCKQAQSYMKRRNIAYVAYDIEKDKAASQRHKELGGTGVPLIIIGNNKMSGFSAEGLEYYLNGGRQ